MLKHSLQFKLSQKLSPQQIQLMKLIQLPTQAFEQRLQEELVENPAFEESSKEDDYEMDDYERSIATEMMGNDARAFINPSKVRVLGKLHPNALLRSQYHMIAAWIRGLYAAKQEGSDFYVHSVSFFHFVINII